MDSMLNSSVMCVAEELLNADAVDCGFCLSEHARNNLWKKRRKLWENLMKKYEECGDESYEKSVKMTDLGCSKKIQNDETSFEDKLGDEECDTNFLSSHVGEMCSPLKLGQKFNSHDSIKKSNKSCYSTKSLQEKLSVSSHEDLVSVRESDLFKKEVKNVHNLNETFVVQCYERADDENSFPLRQKISVENVADERETVSSYKIASYVPDNMHLKMEDVRSKNLFTGATDRTYSSFQVLCSNTNRMANSESDCSSKENNYNYSGRKELDVRPEVITTISTKAGMLADLECEMNVNGQYDVSSKNKGIKELPNSDDIIIEVATDSKKRPNCTENTNKFQNEGMSAVHMLDSVLSENHVIEDYNSDCDIFDKPGKTRKVPKFIKNVNCCIETEMANSESDCSSKENKYNYSARKELDVRPEVITTIDMLADLECDVNGQYDVSSKNKGIKELDISNDIIIEAATDSKKRPNCTENTNKFQNERMSRVQMLDSVLSENHVMEDCNSDCDIFYKPGKTRKVPKFIKNFNCCIETEMANSESDCSSKENKYNYCARKELDVCPEVITTISSKTGMLADLKCEMNVNRQYDVSSKNKGIKELPNSDDIIIEAVTDSKKRPNCIENTNKFQNERMSRVHMLDSVLSENHVIEDYNSDCDIFDKPGKTRKVPKFIKNVNCCIETEIANSESDCSSKENKYNYSARKELDVRPEVITTISTKTGMLADLECEMNVNRQYDVSSKNKGIKELDISNDIIIEAATDSKKGSNCTENTNKFQNERMSRVQMLDSVLSENHVIEDCNSDYDIFDKPGKTRKVPKFIKNVNCCIETEMSKKSRYSTLCSESENLPFRDKYVRNETVSGSNVSVFEESRNCGEKSNCIEIGYSKLKNSRVINNSQSFRSSSLKKIKSGAKIMENEAICDTSTKHKEEANLTDYANELENVRIKRWKPCGTLFVRETKLSKENEEDTKKLSVTSELGKKDNRDEYVTIRTPVEDNFQYKRKRRSKYSFYISRNKREKMVQELNAVSASKNLNGHYGKWTYTNGHKALDKMSLDVIFVGPHLIEQNICGQSVLDKMYVDEINWTNSKGTERYGRIVLEA